MNVIWLSVRKRVDTAFVDSIYFDLRPPTSDLRPPTSDLRSLQRPHIGLQRAQCFLSPFSGGDPLGSGQRGGGGGDFRDMVSDGGLADMGIVLLTLSAAGGVDHQCHITGFNGVHQVGPTKAELFHQFGLDAVFLQE